MVTKCSNEEESWLKAHVYLEITIFSHELDLSLKSCLLFPTSYLRIDSLDPKEVEIYQHYHFVKFSHLLENLHN